MTSVLPIYESIVHCPRQRTRGLLQHEFSTSLRQTPHSDVSCYDYLPCAVRNGDVITSGRRDTP